MMGANVRMAPGRERMMRTPFSPTAVACCLSLTGAVLFNAPAVQARVTKVVIAKTESPTFGGKSFGAVGPYERISGQIIGEVGPKDPLNAIIIDIGFALEKPEGTQPSSTGFQILLPPARPRGKKQLIYPLPNPCRPTALW